MIETPISLLFILLLVRIIRFRKKKDSKSVVSVTRGPVGTEVSG